MILLFFPPVASLQNVGPLTVLNDGESAIYPLYPQFVVDLPLIDHGSDVLALDQVYFTVGLPLIDHGSDVLTLDQVYFTVGLSLIDHGSGVIAFDQVYFTVEFDYLHDRPARIFPMLLNATQVELTTDWQIGSAPFNDIRWTELETDWELIPFRGRDLDSDWNIAEFVSVDFTTDWMIREAVSVDLTTDWQLENATIARRDLTSTYQISGAYASNIIYDDDQDITADVVINEAQFTSRVNGSAGSCVIRVKDTNRNKSFITGKHLDLKINGTYIWRGYVGKVSREYVFDAEDTSDLSKITVFHKIEGVDINILFNKRYVFNQDEPKSGFIVYETQTADNVAVAELVNNWLDLTGDGIDTSSKVEFVGYINEDQEAIPFNPSTTWGEAMATIASWPAALFYLDAEKRLVYTDVDTANAPYALTDRPLTYVGPPSQAVGYREASHLADASDLVNDYLAWGAGYENDQMVFKREEDLTSQSDHGRWQASKMFYGVYTQATINKIADVFVNGSPQSKRGRTDDKISVVCTTYTQGFEPGQKVRFISTAHGIDEVLPIRAMTITFAGDIPEPRYSLTLSHERDVEYSFMDPWVFGDGWDIPDPSVPRPPNPWLPPIPSYPGVILDSFSRTSNWSYIPHVTRETGLPGCGPDPATGWVSEGWGTGEEVEWIQPTVCGGQQKYEPSWVNGFAGVLISAMPYVPQYGDGPGPYAKTTIPNVSKPETGSQPIDRKNLTWKFSFERHERILPSQVTSFGQQIQSVYADNGWWKNYDNSPAYRTATGTNLVSYGAEYASNYWDTAGSGFVYDNPNWQYQSAGWGPGVKTGSALWYLDVACSTGGGSVRRMVHWGSNPGTDAGGTTSRTLYDEEGNQLQVGLWWNACGGGFANIYERYAGGCSTKEPYLDSTHSSYWRGVGTGLAYFGGMNMRDLCFIGDDTDAFLFDQKLRVVFTSGSHTITLDRSQGGPSGYALGASSATVNVSTSVGNPSGTVNTSTDFGFEPGVTYNFRWFRPNNGASYVKIWPDGAGEPAGWTASSRPITDTKSLNPVTAVDSVNDTITAATAWGVVTGEPIRYDYDTYSSDPIGGLVDGQTYYAIPTGNPNVIQLAASYDDALNGIYIEIDGSGTTGSHDFNWNTYFAFGSVGQNFEIRANKYSYQTYKMYFDHFGSISDSVAGRDELLPPEATQPPSGYPNWEQEGGGSDATNRSTKYPYVPGTLQLFINGTYQRPGTDFVEVSPSAGTYKLLFTPHPADKIVTFYVVA